MAILAIVLLAALHGPGKTGSLLYDGLIVLAALIGAGIHLFLYGKHQDKGFPPSSP